MNDKLLKDIISRCLEYIHNEKEIRMIARTYSLMIQYGSKEEIESKKEELMNLLSNQTSAYNLSSKMIEIVKDKIDYDYVFYAVHPVVADKVFPTQIIESIEPEQIEPYALRKIIEKARKCIHNEEEIRMIIRSYYIAEEAHKNHSPRLSGEQYISHPEAVANILIDWEKDAYTISAGLLHDVVEDEKYPVRDIALLVHPIVADIVDGVTRGDKLSFIDEDAESIFSTSKIFEYTDNDIRVLDVKLADRLHNTRTFKFLPLAKIEKKCKENRTIYIPAAMWRGNYESKCELDDLTFMNLEPDRYEKTKGIIDKEYSRRKSDLKMFELILNQLIKNAGIKCEIEFKKKSIYGTYQRLIDGRKLDLMHDLFTFIIKTEEEDCNKILEIIRKAFTHFDKKSKDYIGKPKYNGHQAMHETIATDSGLLQLQITTHDKHKVSKYGPDIPHKIDGSYDMESLREQLLFCRILHEIVQSIPDDKERVEQIKSELFTEVIEVYSITGEQIILPYGATILDFVANLNPALITQIGSIAINDNYISPNGIVTYKLHNRDVVTIRRPQKNEKPLEITADMFREVVKNNSKQLILLNSKASF